MSDPNPNEPATSPPPADESVPQPTAAAPTEPVIDQQPPPQQETSPAAVVEQPPPEDQAEAQAVAQAVAQVVESSPVVGSLPLELPDFGPRAPATRGDQAIDLLNDVELNVKIELGRANMLIEDVLRLGQGAVVELDKLAGDPVDVLVNDRLVARGEILVLNDQFCVRISEIIAGVEEEGLKAGAA